MDGDVDGRVEKVEGGGARETYAAPRVRFNSSATLPKSGCDFHVRQLLFTTLQPGHKIAKREDKWKELTLPFSECLMQQMRYLI